jgi:hypothetical protein
MRRQARHESQNCDIIDFRRLCFPCFQPADEIPSAEKIVIDTSAPLLENLIRILSDESGPAPAA